MSSHLKIFADFIGPNGDEILIDIFSVKVIEKIAIELPERPGSCYVYCGQFAHKVQGTLQQVMQKLTAANEQINEFIGNLPPELQGPLRGEPMVMWIKSKQENAQ